ncbi:MAG: hypothetical protein A3C55_01975 [Gammaproteobacteria bacterium RIFCSPHIGHO2_02_FULL_42_13]|nr:MAG: hypothetical protein A3C55_01975 [Gammaproteobacteria bacterium RIFCSPHIGHO2_02_FULL_42_13]
MEMSGKKRILDYKIVGLGVSTGGPAALHTILSELPKNFPVPIVIVQHMSPGFLAGFVKWLQGDVTLPISLANDKEKLLQGHIYFAPDQKHLSIVENGGSLFASVEASRKPSSFCPSINVLFESLSRIGTGKVLAGVLTGMSGDGIPGICALHKAGHYTFSQDIQSSIVSGMTKEAIESKCVYDVVPLDGIAKFMIKQLQGKIT